MPIQITIADALASGFDALAPSDFKAIAQGIEDDPADEGRQLIAADWLAEQGESELEFCLRWCAARHIRPRYREHYRGNGWGWAEWYAGDAARNPQSVLPQPFRDQCDKTDAASFMGVIAKTAKALLAMQEEMFGVKPLPLPEPEPEEKPEPLPTVAFEPTTVGVEAVAF